MSGIGRRQFLIVGGTLLASPISDAQRAEKRWRIGFLSLDTADSIAGRQALERRRPHESPIVAAAKNATRSIPIVMLSGNFPVETGLVESCAHPGGNVTGTSYISTETLGKQMQMLEEIVPRTRRVAVLGTRADKVIE